MSDYQKAKAKSQKYLNNHPKYKLLSRNEQKLAERYSTAYFDRKMSVNKSVARIALSVGEVVIGSAILKLFIPEAIDALSDSSRLSMDSLTYAKGTCALVLIGAVTACVGAWKLVEGFKGVKEVLPVTKEYKVKLKELLCK